MGAVERNMSKKCTRIASALHDGGSNDDDDEDDDIIVIPNAHSDEPSECDRN